MNRGHVIITGGSSGIGLAIARHYVKEGRSLSIIARNKDRLSDASQLLLKLRIDPAQRIETFSADVSSRHQVENAIEQSVNLLDAPEILITSAGIVIPGYFHSLPVEIFEKMMAVNYLGTVYAVKAIEPVMKRQGKGHIVMLSSGAGLIGIYGYSGYSPSKFAVRGFAEVLQAELMASGIRVSVVYPPDTETPQLVEERKLKPLEAALITESGGVMSADDVAMVIIKGIRQNRFIITPGYSMTALAWLHSLARPLLNSWFKFRIKKSINPDTR